MSWSEAASWSLGHVPTSTETACIGEHRGNPHVDVDIHVAALHVDGDFSLPDGRSITASHLEIRDALATNGTTSITLTGAAPSISLDGIERVGALTSPSTSTTLTAGAPVTGALGDVSLPGSLTLDFPGTLEAASITATSLQLPGTGLLNIENEIDVYGSILGETARLTAAIATIDAQHASVTPVVSVDMELEFMLRVRGNVTMVADITSRFIDAEDPGSSITFSGAHVTDTDGHDSPLILDGTTTWTNGAQLDAESVSMNGGTTTLNSCRWNTSRIETNGVLLDVAHAACIDPAPGHTLELVSSSNASAIRGIRISTGELFTRGGVIRLTGAAHTADGVLWSLSHTKLELDAESLVTGNLSVGDLRLTPHFSGVVGRLHVPMHGTVRTSPGVAVLDVRVADILGTLVIEAPHLANLPPLAPGAALLAGWGLDAAPRHWRIDGLNLAPGTRLGSWQTMSEETVVTNFGVVADPTSPPPSPPVPPLPAVPGRPSLAPIAWRPTALRVPVGLRAEFRIVPARAWTRVTGSTYPSRPGHTTCVRHVATNAAGSTPSAEVCSAAPIDDRGLRARGGFSATRTGWGYAGTTRTARRAGATLTTPRITGATLTIAATTCPACGTVQVVRSGRVIATRSLRANRTTNRALIEVKLSAGDAPVTLRTTTAKLVRVDAVALAIRATS